jgi:hypothetical protein
MNGPLTMTASQPANVRVWKEHHQVQFPWLSVSVQFQWLLNFFSILRPGMMAVNERGSSSK